MASISGATTTDGTFLNIQYNLNQDTFKYIRVRRYNNPTHFELVNQNDVTHSTTGPVSGSFSILRPLQPVVDAIGSPGVLLLEIACIDSKGVSKTYTGYMLMY